MRLPARRNRMPRSIVPLVALALLAAEATAAAAPAAPRSSLPVEADAWLLMATKSGQVLAAERADRRYAPGSLAKAMTAYLVFQAAATGRIDLSDRVRISEREWRMSGSQMFVEVGERITVDKLLQGMLVAGGNDAAHALARHLGVSVAAFVDLMNQEARQLGMEDTHFVNPSGLPAPRQHTSARDMATLARALIRDFPGQYQRFADEAITHNGITQRNRNPVLGIVHGADGLVTGYTERSGYNLIASARQEDMRLLAVLLGAETTGDRLQGAMLALRHGFDDFTTVKVREADRVIERARVWKGRSDFVDAVLAEDLYVTVSPEQARSMSTRPRFPQTLEAPLKEGDRIGSLEVGTTKTLIERQPLLAGHPVAAGSWLDYAVDTVQLKWRAFWREQRRDLFAHDATRSGKEPRS